MSAGNGSKPVPEKDPVNGRFVSGNIGGPGRPRGTRNDQYRAIFQDAITDEMAKALVLRFYEQAMEGHPVAMKIMADRILPTATMDTFRDDDVSPFFALRPVPEGQRLD